MGRCSSVASSSLSGDDGMMFFGGGGYGSCDESNKSLIPLKSDRMSYDCE